MANEIGGTTWRFDTSVTASTLGNMKGHVQSMAWDAGTNGATVIVFDGASAQVWSAQSTASEQNISVEFPRGLTIDEIGVSIDAGNLYIYHHT